MKLLASVCGVVAALTIACVATGQDKDEAKRDLDKMQGTWRVVSSQVGDEKASEAEFKDRKVTVKGNTLIYETGNERKEKREGPIKLDPKTKAFDWTWTAAGATMLAIYELKGDDLRIGFGNDGLIRPKRFEMGKENVVWLLVLKRQKKDIEDLPAGAGQPKPPVVQAGKTESIEELIPELPRVENLLAGPFLSNIKQPTTLSGGFRFRFPYDGGGAMKTFLIDRPGSVYLWPPKVDASTAEGRKAIFQALRDAHKGPHFTMDGQQLLVFNSARIVPFRFKDERLRKAWIDVIRRIPPKRLVESVKKRHAAAKNTAGPVERSYVLPLAETSFLRGADQRRSPGDSLDHTEKGRVPVRRESLLA